MQPLTVEDVLSMFYSACRYAQTEAGMTVVSTNDDAGGALVITIKDCKRITTDEGKTRFMRREDN